VAELSECERHTYGKRERVCGWLDIFRYEWW